MLLHAVAVLRNNASRRRCCVEEQMLVDVLSVSENKCCSILHKTGISLARHTLSKRGRLVETLDIINVHQ